MFRKTYLIVATIVLGAALPYLLSDDMYMATAERVFRSISGWLSGAGGEANRATPPELSSDGPLGGEATAAPVRTEEITRFATTTSSFGGTDPAYGDLERQLTANTSVGPPPLPSTSADRPLPLPAVAGPPGASLEQLLRFDITPQWVSANWARVSTRLADIDLQGWRVPMAMGHGPGDLAGSITYYFDPSQYVQRITVHGYTADPQGLVQLATQRFRMQRIPSNQGDLYLATAGEQTLGALWCQHSAVLRTDLPATRYEVSMELNRVQSRYGLSEEMRDTIQRLTKLKFGL